MSYNFTREERETFMNTTEADDYWNIYTDTPKYQHKLKKYADKYPELCKCIRSDPELGMTTWIVSRKYCDFTLRKPRSPEYIQSLRERGKAQNNLRPRNKNQSKS